MNIKQVKKIAKQCWNLPMFGKKALIDYIFKTDIRLNIPFQKVYIHDRLLNKLDNLVLTLKALFNDNFASADFLIYAHLEEYLLKNELAEKHYLLIGRYFFQTILANLQTLIQLTDTEQKFENEILNDFQDSSLDLMKQKYPKLIFQAKLKKTQQFYIQELIKEEDIFLLKKYYYYLINLSEVDGLLYFFYLLKNKNLDNWDLFTKIKTLIYEHQEEFIDKFKSFDELNSLLLLTKIEENLLIEIIDKFIPIQQSSSNKLTAIANTLKYTALSHKYQSCYPQFRRFLKILRKWEKKYDYIVSLREKYSSDKYLIPSSFKIKVHGFDLYQKYQNYLDSNNFCCLVFLYWFEI